MSNNDRFKFRAKRIDNNEFAYGFLCFIFRDVCRIYCSQEDKFYDCATKTLGQCTGLHDKNGTPIFEGDIILSNEQYGGDYFVISGGVRGYCYDAVAVEEYEEYLESGKNDIHFRLSSTAYHIITDHGPCTVVGNIHENPKLLESVNE